MRSYHVAAGSYYAGNSKPMILQAYLGTCVAVALYDPESGIGGGLSDLTLRMLFNMEI